MGCRRDRSFTGCSKCRARKIKCDETKPACKACMRLRTPCPGYGVKLTWIEDGVTTSSGLKTEGRRTLACEETWEGFNTLPHELVDLLVAQCDGAPAKFSGAYALCLTTKHNPFGAFPLEGENNIGKESVFPTLPTITPIARALTTSPDWIGDERYLFHHYITHVASLMLPYRHPRNPWQMHYPAAATNPDSLHQKPLHNAILAHAAYNVAHLRNGEIGMLDTASKYYGKALQDVASQVAGSSPVDFNILIAVVMSLMFAEVYSGRPQTWRCHFLGAWTLFTQYREFEPWKLADSVCVSLQSLIIIKIIGGTSEDDGAINEIGSPSQSKLKWHNIDEVDESPKALAPILLTSEFGFTIGAPRVVLQCIASITHYRHRRQRGAVGPGAMDDLLQKVLSRLNGYRENCEAYEFDRSKPAIHLQPDTDSHAASILPLGHVYTEQVTAQRKAFLYAAYIYLYRVLLDASPAAVRFYVSQTFETVSLFFTTSSGNFSIWPAFIAAAEAYTEEDLAAARNWLESANSFGLGNRNLIRRVLEEVWHRREVGAAACGMETGHIAVDWRKVMHELDCDVLII